jgi:hypothetical protein
VAFLRIVAVLFGLGIAGCALAWMFTRERRWLDRALRLLTIAVIAGLVFFGVLLWQHLA